MTGKVKKLIKFVKERREAGQSWGDIYQRLDNQIRFGRKSGRSKVGRAEMRALKRVVQSGNLLRGPQVKRFAQRFKEMYGVNNAVPSTSGTAAVHVAVAAINPSPGDEIITTPVTDIGGINPIIYQGAIPVFADIDPRNWGLDPASVEKLITPRTRAIIAVHLFGNPCDLQELRRISLKHGVYLVEDCAQAHLSRYRGKLCGTMGDIGTYSFQHSKQMTTGEGGMTVTDNPALARRAELFVDKGWKRTSRLPRDYPQLGLNYRMTEMQGAVGLAQLDRIERISQLRSRNGTLLAEMLGEVPFVNTQHVEPEDVSTWWQFGLTVDSDAPFTARSLGRRLQRRGIPANTRYMSAPIFLYHEPLLRRELFGDSPMQLDMNPDSVARYEPGACPVAEDLLSRIVLLTPPNEHFSEKDVQRLYKEIKTVTESFSNSSRTGAAEAVRCRIGLIGCGDIAYQHLKAIRNVVGMDVTAIADLSEDALKTMGSDEEIASRYTDYQKMLAEEKPDAVVICTWPGLHAEMTIAAAEAGIKNILCEKPMSLSLRDADAMIHACDKHGARLIIGHQHRFNPQVKIARDAVRSGKLGQVRHIWGQHRSSLMNNGTHLVDCIRYILDAEPVIWAYGQLDRSAGGRDRGHAAEDSSTGVIRFKNGTRATLETGDIADPQHFRLHIYGTEGHVSMSYADIDVFTRSGGHEANKLSTELELTDQYKELLACMDGSCEAHRSPGTEARAALEVLVAVMESSRLGRPIHFPVRQMDHPLDMSRPAEQESTG